MSKEEKYKKSFVGSLFFHSEKEKKPSFNFII
jgi:hypothetical protein